MARGRYVVCFRNPKSHKHPHPDYICDTMADLMRCLGNLHRDKRCIEPVRSYAIDRDEPVLTTPQGYEYYAYYCMDKQLKAA